MKNRNQFLIGILILVVGLTLILNRNIKNKLSKKETPLEPYDEFMFQRTYPNKTFDVTSYRKGLNEAFNNASAKRSTLQWNLEGPGNIGGRFNCIAVNPNNSNVMYAGSANGGVWKTDDNGQTWNSITDSFQYQAIGAIAINPNNANEIWVGTGDLNISGTLYTGNGVYKSTDAGLTWTHLGLPDSYEISSILFNGASNEVLISTMGNPFNKDNSRGVYKSTNGGIDFVNCLFVNDSTGVIDMVQNPNSKNIVYAASFTRLRTDARSIFSGTEVYIYKSNDFGQTWYVLSGGLPNGISHERLGLTICKSNPNVLYALYGTSDGESYPELYKTSDAGSTWSAIPTGMFDASSYGAFGWYFGKIYVDPNDENTLYMPGVDLQYSTDGGVNWSLRTPPWWYYEVHADGHYIHFNSSTDFIYCTDGGLYRTEDAGETWADIENIPNNQFYAICENPNTIGEYAGGVQDNGTMVGNASQLNNFIRLYGGDGFTVEFTPSPFLTYAESQYGNIVFDDSYFSGNWNYVQTDQTQRYNWHTPYFVSKHNQNTLFFAGETVMRIDDAPYGNYNIISPVLHSENISPRVSNVSTIYQSPLDSNILYAGVAEGKVWNSLDYGLTWNEITPFQGLKYYVTKVMASPNQANTVYTTRSGYRSNNNTPWIFKSTNNGNDWVNISGDLPNLAVNDIEIVPGFENIIFIANDAGVYYTENSGVNWTRLGSNLPYVAVLDIDLNFDNSRLIAGTFGRSMYTIDVQSIVGVQSKLHTNNIVVYPNPTASYFTVKNCKKINNITVYNTEGKKLSVSNSNLVNISELNPATYLVEINDDGNKVWRKVIKN